MTRSRRLVIIALTGVGVTIRSTVEVNESFTEFPLSTYSISFLTDDIARLRYVCIDGQLRKIMVGDLPGAFFGAR